ncbi:MAG: hypothetical protein DRQ89_12100, partial [Epsilonproteobacteria bacterium]
TFTRSGRWLIVADKARYYSDKNYFDKLKGNGHVSLRSKLEEYIKASRKIDVVTVTNQKNWIIVAGKNRAYSSASAFNSIGLRPILNRLINEGKKIQSISVSDNKKWVIVANGRAYGNNLPKEMAKILDVATTQEQRELKTVQFRPGRSEWVIVAGHQYWASPAVKNRAGLGVAQFRRKNWAMDIFSLDSANGLSIISNNEINLHSIDRKSKLELQLKSGNKTRTIWNSMKAHKVPGVVIAIIHDNKIQSVRGFGKRRGNKGTVFYDTIFPVASMSKAVASLGIMKSYEKGIVSLGQTPMNVGSKYPNSLVADWIDFIDDRETAGNGLHYKRSSRIRLGQLLTHTAGLSKHGIGLWNISILPSKRDILLGSQKMKGGVRPSKANPGVRWKYSGGGLTLAEVMMETITNKDFRTLMKSNVLDPIGMKDSTFGSLSRDQKKRLAFGHGKNLTILPYRECPGKAAGGLFSTGLDYARFVQTLMNLGKKRPNLNEYVVRKDIVEKMLSPAIYKFSSQVSCAKEVDCKDVKESCIRHKCVRPIPVNKSGTMLSGAGIQLTARVDNTTGPDVFSHGGTQYGYRSYFMGSPSKKSGLVILTNGLNEWEVADPLGGDPKIRGASKLISEIRNTFRKLYW